MDGIKDSVVIENPRGSYKDFGLNSPDEYPVSGVLFYADYGYISGFIGEDGHDLDVFISNGSEYGYFTVWRNEDIPEEHKFYLGLTTEELDKTLAEYEKVLIKHTRMSERETYNEIERFKKHE